MSGKNPVPNEQAYQGVRAVNPPNVKVAQEAPGSNQKRVAIGDIQVDQSTGIAYMLTDIVAGAQVWSVIGEGTTGDIITITGDVGGAQSAIAGNFNILGTASQILVTGSAGTETLSLIGPYAPATYTDHAVLVGSGSGDITAIAVGDTGEVLIGSTGNDPAFGALGVNSGLTIHGVLLGENNSAIVATAAGTDGQVLIGATGADPAFGDLGVDSGLTDHGVLVGGGLTAIDALAVGTNGQVLVGSTGADPVFATISSTTLTSTLGAGTLALNVNPSVYGRVSVTLTSAQIKALETVPITLLAAQGAGTSILPIQVQAKFTYGGSNVFTNPQDIVLMFPTMTGNFLATITGAGFLDQTVNMYNMSGVDADVVTAATIVENAPVIMFNDDTAITGNAANDNTITVTMIYTVLTQA